MMLSFSRKNTTLNRHHVSSKAPLSTPLLALLLGPVCSLPVLAEISDTLHPFLSTTISHDDNLLRLSKEQQVGQGGYGDTSKQVAGGLTFERPIGRQQVSAQVTLSRVTFDRFDQLDYNGKDLQANWKWVLGNHLSGDIGGNYEQTIAPFTDFHSDQRNLRTHKREYANGAWLFHPRWQVRAGFTRNDYDYELDAQRYSNRTEDMSEAGVDYLAPSGSKVGVQLRHLKGSYPDGFYNSVLVNDGYTQDEVKANILWLYSGTTQLQFLGGWARREHSVFTSRDDSGTNGRLVLYWSPLGKVKLTGSVWREFAAVESTVVNSSLNNGVSLGAAWAATGKITVNGQVKRETRDFSAQTEGGASLDDEARNTSLGVTYLPRDAIELNLTGFKDDRDGSRAAGTSSYSSKGVSLSAKIQF